jgi:hypothetical protein
VVVEFGIAGVGGLGCAIGYDVSRACWRTTVPMRRRVWSW